MSLSEDQTERLREILTTLEPIAHTLSGASPGFVADQVKRFEQYGSGIRLSPKQWSWLESLYEKAGGAPLGERDDEPEGQFSDKKDEPDDSISF